VGSGVDAKGPRGENRPSDVIGNAVKAMRIATGEIEEDLPERGTAAELASKDGKAWAAAMTPEPRAEIAKTANAAIQRKLSRAKNPAAAESDPAARQTVEKPKDLSK
jgi:hypothetical protein